MTENGCRINVITIMVMMVIVICISEIYPRIGESSCGYKTFPCIVIAQWNRLLVIDKDLKGSPEFTNSSGSQIGVFQNVVRNQADSSIFCQRFPGKVLAIEFSF